jgi:membrane protein implicated in regulation of membrane protease activity
MLRRFLIVFGVLVLIVAVVLYFVTQAPLIVVVELALAGVVLACGIVFERRGYRPKVDRTRGRWQLTGERFVDPTTGKMMEVRFNPETGERDYVESGSPEPGKAPPA